MKKLLILFCLIASQFNVFAQAESFEGVLVYGRKFYNSSKRIDSEDPNIPPIMNFTVKGNLSLAEIVTEKDFMTAMNYSIIKDSDKKEGTMLARIANQKMAVKFEPSYFNTSKLYKVVSANQARTRTIAGLTCSLGYALIESEFGTQDTMRVWYTNAYNAIPYQFETSVGPGLIVSMQQDDVSYWELKEIRKENVDPIVFEIPKEYFPMTQGALQDFISTLDQLEIEEEEDPMEKRGNEINHEEED
jgi:hypothetical protein